MSDPYIIKEDGPNVIVTLDGRLTLADAERLFALVLDKLDGQRMRGLIYDARALDGFDASVMTSAKSSAKLLDERGVRMVVVSEKASVRLALSAIQLVTRQKMRAVATLEQARAVVGQG